MRDRLSRKTTQRRSQGKESRQSNVCRKRLLNILTGSSSESGYEGNFHALRLNIYASRSATAVLNNSGKVVEKTDFVVHFPSTVFSLAFAI